MKVNEGEKFYDQRFLLRSLQNPLPKPVLKVILDFHFETKRTKKAPHLTLSLQKNFS